MTVRLQRANVRSSRWSARLPRWSVVAGLTVASAALAVGVQPVQAAPGHPASARKDDGSSSSFRVATFNVLGASHTGPAGDKKHFDGYEARTPRAVALLDANHIDAVGLQEFQMPQWRLFKQIVRNAWHTYPGRRLGDQPVQNSIAWRTSVWKPVEKNTFEIPYFKGRPVKVPYVKLRHRVTGREVWFMNVHNPADKYGAAAQWRRRAVGIESALASRLSENGTPVVLTGDFNDRETAFCQVTRLSPLVSTSGGSYGGGKCTPPSRMPVDWVFTSRTLTPSNYTIVEGPAVADVTDHFVVYSDLSFGKQAKRH